MDRYAWANSADPDQTAPRGAVWSGSTLFAICRVYTVCHLQTQIRLLLEEQSDQSLHCLPFRLHRLDSLLYGRAT